MAKTTITRSSCRGCHGVCQLLVHQDETGRIVKITGDKDSPTSKGYICPKGARAADTLYHPDRITRPMLREKGRGEAAWRAIEWDEALDLMESHFKRIIDEHGPEYIAIAQGTGRPYTEFTPRFCNALGSPNHVSPAHNCYVPRNICAGMTMGWFPQPDIYGRSGTMPRCVMVFGSNIMESGGEGGYCGKMVTRALDQADKTIIIDPRRIKACEGSDYHLPLRPGSECALMLGMLHAVIVNEAYDKDFVENYCSGFDKLQTHIQPFTIQWAQEITGVPAELIEEAALTFARTGPSALIWGNGIDESVSAFQTARAVFLLLALCGSIDVPGGMVRWVPPANLRPKSHMVDHSVQGAQFLSPEQQKKCISPFPLCPGAHPPSFWQACVDGKPYKPKAIWLIGTNPIMTHTRGDVVQSALRDHMEFVVTSDFFMTPTAAVSDLVLPAAHWLEQEDVVYFHKIWCVLARKKLAQVGEARDDRAVMLDMAHRLGLDEAFPWKDWDDYLKWILEPSGMTFDEFAEKDILFGDMEYRKYEKEGFKTPSGKFELYSNVMEHMGLDPMPVYTEPPLSPVSTPELLDEFPFILMTGCKIKGFFHTEGRNIPALRKIHPDPMVDMHPEDAAALGLEAGQMVEVATPYGRQRFKLHPDDRLQRGVVHAEHAWWFPEREEPDFGCFTSNANMLFGNEHFDPISGAQPLKCLLCKVQPLSDSEEAAA
jgi:anaerobic selenocysteine-containing dehydrogenase